MSISKKNHDEKQKKVARSDDEISPEWREKKVQLRRVREGDREPREARTKR